MYASPYGGNVIDTETSELLDQICLQGTSRLIQMRTGMAKGSMFISLL